MEENIDNNKIKFYSPMIYSVIEQGEPIDPTSIIINSFSTKDKQLEFFKKRINDYAVELTDEEMQEVMMDEFIEIEEAESEDDSAIVISCVSALLNN